jgi:hypothetical protein
MHRRRRMIDQMVAMARRPAGSYVCRGWGGGVSVTLQDENESLLYSE